MTEFARDFVELIIRRE